ncbi:Helicase associated domain protein [Streptomyces sp. NPDC001667]
MSVTAAAQRRPSSLLFPSVPYVARVRPLARETTLSFVGRLAGRFGVSAADLIAEFFATGNRKPMSSLDCDGEVYFNVQARTRFAALSRVPPRHLEQALPAWTRLEPEGRYDSGPAATFYGASSIAPTTPACAGCTAVRTGRIENARRYTEAHEHVCLRHRVWLTPMSSASTAAREASGGGLLSLARLPSVVDAQRRHRALLRARSEAAQAFSVARAVITTWWNADWPQETIWPQRQRLLAHVDVALDAVRDAITYPEAVLLTSLLTSPLWQQNLLAEAGGHQPHTPADVPRFTRELAQRLERPWLSDVLAHVADGPFTAWLQACWRSRAGQREQTRTMWWIAPAYRPANPRISRRAARKAASVYHSHTAARAENEDGAQGFARGLGLARAYAAEHGHLCIPYRHEQDGFQLGLWLSNQRSTGPQLSPARSQALADLDPWWNPPWSTLWQRYYLRARQMADTGCALAPDRGFPGTSPELGSWLYRQCQQYDQLHPQQRGLLTGIGIDADSARHAQPRRRNLAKVRENALARARRYCDRHGHLCAPASDTQDGFPIGQVLANLRVRARRSLLDPDVARQLAAMDPWWAPPWPSGWQRTYYTVRDRVRAGHLLDPGSAFLSWDDELGQWLYSQCVTYAQLASAQRELLSALGLTQQTASRARPNPATDRPSLETGLHYARSYVDQHGGLDVPPGHHQEGFPLGTWVARQRSQADNHAIKFASPWPAAPLLEALDPWWNPSWPAEWQASYRGALALVTSGLQLRPQEGFPGTPEWTGQWLYQQCTGFSELHTEQQRRLARLGISPQAARNARPRRIESPRV